MRKLTGVLMVIAVAVTLAIPAGASARFSHQKPRGHHCSNEEGFSHPCPTKKGRKNGNLSHRFQDHPRAGV